MLFQAFPAQNSSAFPPTLMTFSFMLSRPPTTLLKALGDDEQLASEIKLLSSSVMSARSKN